MARQVLPPDVTLPKCKGCGASNPRVVANGLGGHLWLCADCEYKRENPDYVPLPTAPQDRRPKRLQEETLF